jgi:uncharacterized protein
MQTKQIVSQPADRGVSRYRKAIIIFFLVAFGGAWAGWIAFARINPQSPAWHWALQYGSGSFASLAGIVAAAVVGGADGLKDLARRCVRPGRLGWWIYVFAVPLVWLSLTDLLYASLVGSIGPIHPAKYYLMFTPEFLFWFVTGPLGEEIGWRGFLLPEMLRRFRPLPASILIGVIHALWHIPIYADIFADPPRALHFMVSVICYNVLYSVVFLNTRRSVMMAIVIHWTINLTPYAMARIVPSMPDNKTAFWLESVALVAVTATVVGIWRKQMMRVPDAPRMNGGAIC